MATLKSILAAHPEWADVEIVLWNGSDTPYSYIDEDWAYVRTLDEDEEIDPNQPLPVLVFNPN